MAEEGPRVPTVHTTYSQGQDDSPGQSEASQAQEAQAGLAQEPEKEPGQSPGRKAGGLRVRASRGSLADPGESRLVKRKAHHSMGSCARLWHGAACLEGGQTQRRRHGWVDVCVPHYVPYVTRSARGGFTARPGDHRVTSFKDLEIILEGQG